MLELLTIGWLFGALLSGNAPRPVATPDEHPCADMTNDELRRYICSPDPEARGR